MLFSKRTKKDKVIERVNLKGIVALYRVVRLRIYIGISFQSR